MENRWSIVALAALVVVYHFLEAVLLWTTGIEQWPKWWWWSIVVRADRLVAGFVLVVMTVRHSWWWWWLRLEGQWVICCALRSHVGGKNIVLRWCSWCDSCCGIGVVCAVRLLVVKNVKTRNLSSSFFSPSSFKIFPERRFSLRRHGYNRGNLGNSGTGVLYFAIIQVLCNQGLWPQSLAGGIKWSFSLSA